MPRNSRHSALDIPCWFSADSWPFLNGRCCRVFLLMRGTTFYTSQKDHIADQEQEQNNILCIISSHSIEFPLICLPQKMMSSPAAKPGKTKTCCPVSGSKVGINETLDVSRARTITCPRDTNTCTTQWDGVHLFFKLAWFLMKKKSKGRPTVASRVCLSTLLLIISCDNESSKQIVLDPKRCGFC